jgi:hypothetical protein
MRKILICLLILLAIPCVLADVSVKHSFEQKQDGLYVHVRINSDSQTKVLDLGELIPETWKIETWTIDSEKVQFESTAGKFMNKNYNVNHWKFSELTGDTELVYRISPKSTGSYGIVSLWIYPNGFNMDKLALNVKL